MSALKLFGLVLSLWIANMLNSQALGDWTSYLPYAGPKQVAINNDFIFCATNGSFFTVNRAFNDIRTYSTVNGMAEIGIRSIAYDNHTERLLIAYESGNIDLLDGEDFINLPGIKNSQSIIGERLINDIFFVDGFAYLSCNFGIVKLDMNRLEIAETYKYGQNGQSLNTYATVVSPDGKYLFAASDTGVYRGSLEANINLLSFTNWELVHPEPVLVDTTGFLPKYELVAENDRMLMSTTNAIYEWINGEWVVFTTLNDRKVKHMSSTKEGIFTVEQSEEGDFELVEYIADQRNPLAISLSFPVDFEVDGDQFWIADSYRGLVKATVSGSSEVVSMSNTPSGAPVFQMDYTDNQLWVAHGGSAIQGHAQGYDKGLSGLTKSGWKQYNKYKNYEVRDVSDYVSIAKLPGTDTIYAGTVVKGLVRITPSSIERFDSTNSILSNHPSWKGAIQVRSLAIDDERNLWMANSGNDFPLKTLTPAGDWYQFKFPEGVAYGSHLLVGDYNQIWMVMNWEGAAGVGILDHNGTVSDPTDDQVKLLKTGIGRGNLPSNEVRAIAKDLDGEIWLATSDGIAVVFCPFQVFDGCDAELIIVELDGIAEPLMGSQYVYDIEVDGANRKWIGTTNGAYLLSEDGQEQIRHFTKENSPLFSNEIKDIVIDDRTGEIYFGTELGLISYRGDAIAATSTHQDVLVYPNPVREQYRGPIAVKGLVNEADVRFTDAAGNLVYKTKSLGGQAVWDGNDLAGNRVATGVYYVFSTDELGNDTHVAKFAVVN